jgi:DNA repair protein RecO (recombination protein O)
MRIDNEPGYILHQKPFSETSVLLDVFTQNHGRVGLIAKGAKRPRSPFKPYLFPFKLLRLSYVGKNELKTLTLLDSHEDFNHYTHGNQLIFGLYLNELILRFLKKEDPHPELFSAFHLSMGYLFGLDELCEKYNLSKNHLSQIILRATEINLLMSVGYGIEFSKISHTYNPIILTDNYYYDPVIGFNQILTSRQENSYVIPGKIICLLSFLDSNQLDVFLNQLVNLDIDLNLALRLAKKILRQALDFHLGEKKIHTRELAGIEWLT